jgi:hypothetical protein
MVGRKTCPLIPSPDSMPGLFSSTDLYQQDFASIIIICCLHRTVHTYLRHAISKHPLNHKIRRWGRVTSSDALYLSRYTRESVCISFVHQCRSLLYLP